MTATTRSMVEMAMTILQAARVATPSSQVKARIPSPLLHQIFIREGSIDRLVDFDADTDKLDLSGMRSLLTGSNANLSWSKMFVEKDPEVILQKDRPYLIFDTEQHTLAYREAGSSSSTIFAKFDFVWLGPSNIIG